MNRKKSERKTHHHAPPGREKGCLEAKGIFFWWAHEEITSPAAFRRRWEEIKWGKKINKKLYCPAFHITLTRNPPPQNKRCGTFSWSFICDFYAFLGLLGSESCSVSVSEWFMFDFGRGFDYKFCFVFIKTRKSEINLRGSVLSHTFCDCVFPQLWGFMFYFLGFYIDVVFLIAYGLCWWLLFCWSVAILFCELLEIKINNIKKEIKLSSSCSFFKWK